MSAALASALTFALTFGAGLAWGHGGQPQISHFIFPSQTPDEVWALTDVQGLYAGDSEAITWLCEDAAAPFAGFKGLALIGDGTQDWLVVTAEGIFASADGGCSFTRVSAPLSRASGRALSAHPDRLGEVLVLTDTFGGDRAPFLTVDGGQNWQRSRFAAGGILQQVERALGNPELLYLRQDLQLSRSVDGGRTFQRLEPGPPELGPDPAELRLLATSPTDAETVFVALERFPQTYILRSADAGETWVEVARVDDFPVSLTLDRDGVRGLLYTRNQALRSEDGGHNWAASDLPEAPVGCLKLQPGTAQIWGCADPYSGAPWAMASSADFGESWQVVLAGFEGAGRWDCPAQSPSARCCGSFCPGELQVCEGQVEGVCAVPDVGMLDAGLQDSGQPDFGAELDVGGFDSGLDAGVDRGVLPDMGALDGVVALDAMVDTALVDLGSDAARRLDATLDRGVMDAYRWVVRDARPVVVPTAPPSAASGGGCTLNTGPAPASFAVCIALWAVSLRKRR